MLEFIYNLLGFKQKQHYDVFIVRTSSQANILIRNVLSRIWITRNAMELAMLQPNSSEIERDLGWILVASVLTTSSLFSFFFCESEYSSCKTKLKQKCGQLLRILRSLVVLRFSSYTCTKNTSKKTFFEVKNICLAIKLIFKLF